MGHLQLRDELAESTKDAINALLDLWAVVRHYGPGPHPGTGTPQTVHGDIGTDILSSGRAEEFGGVLYHGTTRRHLPAISQYGLEPRIGPMVEWAYGEYAGEEYNDPQTGESMVPTYTYFTGPQTQEMQFSNETAMAKAFGYVRQAVSFEMYGDLHHDVTWDDVEKHGLLVAVDEEELEGLGFHMRGNDDIFYDVYYDWDDANEKMIIHHDETRMGAYTGPEPGDYFTENITTPSKVIYGKELVRLGKYLENKLMTLGPEAQMLLPLEYRNYLARHYGPGPHPGTGTSQDVHGSGGGPRASASTKWAGVRDDYFQQVTQTWTPEEERLEAWREKNPDLISELTRVMEEAEGTKEASSVWMKAEGEKVRFIIAPDGRVFIVDDHDDIARQMRGKALTEVRFRESWIELEADFNPERATHQAQDANTYLAKIDMVNMGFIRGTVVYGESIRHITELDVMLSTPVGPHVRRTLKEFLEMHAEDEIRFDANLHLGRKGFSGQDIGYLKTVIRRSEEEIEERHYGPGAHASGSSQDVHGNVATVEPRSIEELQAEAGRLLQTGPSPTTIKTPGDMSSGRYFIGPDGTLYKVAAYSTHISTGYKVTDVLEDELQAHFGEDNLHHSFISDLGFIRMIAHVENDAGRSPRPGWENSIILDVRSKPTRKQMEVIEDMLLYNDAKTQWDYSTGEFHSYKYESGTGLEDLKKIAGVVRHYGPGPHSGTGTSQDVHGSGNGARAQVIEIDVRPLADLQEIAYENLLNAIFPLWVSSPTDIARARGVTQMFIAADGRIFELPGEYMHQQAADAGLEGIQDEVAELANMDGDATALFTYGLHFIRSVAFNSDRNFTDGELMIDVRRKPTRAQIETIEDILTAYRVEGIEPKLQWDWMSAGRYFPMESGTELQRLKDVTGVVRHYGPGPHSGTGTSQDVHGSGDIAPDQWMADFNKQLDALEDYFIDSHEEISSALNNEGWMDRSGTMYSLPRGDTHWSVAIDALHRSGVWSDWQAELARKMSSEATDPNIELINYGFIRFRGGGEYEDILAFEILEFDELTRGQREVIQVETQLAINAGWEVMVQPHAQRMGVPDMYETWEVQEKLGLTTRHYGPGAHPGTGTSQDVHGSGDGAAAVDTFIPDWTPTRYDDMPDRVKTFDIIEDAGAWGIYEGELHSTASKDHTWMARQITGDENATSDIFEVRGMVGRYRGAPIIVVYLTGDAGVNYGFPEMWLPDAQENMDLALKRWDDIVNEMAFGGEEPFLYVWDGTGVWIEKPSASKYFKMRHYGPGPHPGTGTSQDIHGGGAGPRSTSVRMTPTSRKQSGLGDFNIDRPAPSQNNSIVFDDEELRAKGYSEEVIKQQREWFFANVSAAIMKMEDELDIEIHGMEVTNSIMDLAERQAGPLVMGHPTRREAFLGRLREDTDEWLGGYYKGVVWLDDNHQGEILSGPEDYDFRETVNHEVGHFLTASDGRAKFGPDYVISMDDETYKPSKSYLDTMMKFYGDDESVVDDEYRADLIASYPIYAEEWIRIIPGTMNKHDKRNQAALVAALQEEAGYIIGPFTQRAEEDDDVLVFFPRAGEIRGVPRSALRNLPKDAVILSEVFKK